MASTIAYFSKSTYIASPYEADRFIFSVDHGFADAVSRAAGTPVSFDLNDAISGKAVEQLPLGEEGNARGLCVVSFPLRGAEGKPLTQARGGSYVYVVSRSDARELSLEALQWQGASHLLAYMISTAIFLIGASNSELGELANQLRAELPHPFSEHSELMRKLWAEARYPYITHLQKKYRQNEPPEVIGSDLTPSNSETLRRIRNARKIELLRADLTGSLTGKPMLLVEAHPADPQSGPYTAIVKERTRETIEKELDGHQKLLAYFNKLGGTLAPQPQYWPDQENPETGTLVIPEISGNPLSKLLGEKWFEQGFRRVWFIAQVMDRLSDFLKAIGSINTETATVNDILIKQFALDKRSKKRAVKLEEVWRSLGIDPSQPRIGLANYSIVNPAFAFRLISQQGAEAPWKDVSTKRLNTVTYSHGDFHCGNVLVDLDEADTEVRKVYVIDFDYVGTGPQHYDRAMMEASFLISISTNPDLDSFDRWRTYFLESILFLSTVISINGINLEDGGYVTREKLSPSIENNRLAYDSYQIIKHIRPDKDIHDMSAPYRACLIAALFRLLASHHKTYGEELKKNGKMIGFYWTAIGYLGILLEDVLKVSVSTQSPIMNLADLRWQK